MVDPTPTTDQAPLGPPVTLTTHELRDLVLAAGQHRAEPLGDDEVAVYLARADAADALFRAKVAAAQAGIAELVKASAA